VPRLSTLPPSAPRALAVLLFAPPAAADPPALPEPADIPGVEAVVAVRDFGAFRIRFYRDEAPNHVAHFLSLVAEGFYDRLAIHRVIPDLLVQTGDPRTAEDERAASADGFRLPAEETARPVSRGSVVLAWRGSEPGTARTEWFVSLGDFPEMRDGTVIGSVVEGMDVVDRVSQVSTFADRSPYHRVEIESIRLAAPPPERAAGGG